MRSLYGMLVAGAIALAGLGLYDKRINGETFALDPTVTLSTENWKGVLFTAPSVTEIKTLIARSRGEQPAYLGEHPLQDAGPRLDSVEVEMLGGQQGVVQAVFIAFVRQGRVGGDALAFSLQAAEAACPGRGQPSALLKGVNDCQRRFPIPLLEELPGALLAAAPPGSPAEQQPQAKGQGDHGEDDDGEQELEHPHGMSAFGLA